jgi:hypothetical protein
MAHVSKTTYTRQGAGAQRASNKRQAEARVKLEAVLTDCMEAGLGAQGIGSAVAGWLFMYLSRRADEAQAAAAGAGR